MATYVNNLRLKEITTGDEDGTWGTSTNTNLELITDGFSLGTKQMAADANETFTMPDATADATRSLYLKFTSAVDLTATREITLGPNTVSKTWIIENATSGSQIITIKQGSGATVNIPNGSKVMIVTDGAGAGAAVFNANPTEVGGSVTSVGGTGTVNGITLTGTVTSSGNLTLGGTLGSVDLTSQITGTLPVANGGTGVTSSTGTGSVVLSTSPTFAGLTTTGSVNIDQNNAFTNTNITSENTNTDKGNFIRFMQVASGSIPAPDFLVGHAGDNTGDAVLRNVSSSSMKLYTNNTEKMRIDASGNVGIGNSSPTQKLDVSGTVAATNVQETVYVLTGTAIDAGNGGIQTKTLAANTTFTDSLASGESIVLQLEAGASYTVTWPTMQWVTSGGNVAPTLTAKDTLVFWKVSSTLYGAYTGSYV